MSHIGILLTASPFQFENWETAVNIADAALEKGHTVSFFLTVDGVLNPFQRQFFPLHKALPRERFSAAVDRGARVLICGIAAQMRGLNGGDYIRGVTVGGLTDFALMLTEIDRLVCL
jgi:tRNA 2-thiouridine synthesizing protein D